MANEESLGVLLSTNFEGWNRWRRKHPCPDLSYSDLRERRLSLRNLSGVNFCGASLRNANLELSFLNQTRLANVDMKFAHLVKATINDAHLDAVNLIEADLSGVQSSRAWFNDARMSGARVVAADFTETRFRGCDLSWVNFENTTLKGAVFEGGSLVGANLRGAQLQGAILIDVAVSDLDIHGAALDATGFNGLDLSGLRGLKDAVHEGPSFVSTCTLLQSKGKLSEVFLRGCGLPESLIQNHRSSVPLSADDFYSCFISYSHTDKTFARRLHDQLQARGIRCWLDEKEMRPGDDIYERVDRGVRLSDKVLLCASESSLNSWWVDDEIDRAFAKERQIRTDPNRGDKVRVLIPLNLDGYLNDGWDSGKAQTVRSRIAAEFRGWGKDSAKFEAGFKDVVRALRKDGREEAVESKW